MLRIVVAASAFAALALVIAPTPAEACGGTKNKTAAKSGTTDAAVKKAEPTKLSAAELQKLLADSKAKVTVLDVNSDEVRKKYGTITGATVLTSYDAYSMKELPESKDDKIVFYCSTTRCGASKTAAKRALKNGYKDVSVLPVGIMGWAEKGHAVDKPANI